jgi:hypothetical protein
MCGELWVLTKVQKDSSQETVISLMGMLAGSVIVPYITSTFATWFSLLLLLVIHLYTNYRAVRAVCLPSLNCQRACIVFSDFLARRNALKYAMSDEVEEKKYDFLTPREVFVKENIFASPAMLRHGHNLLGKCRIGISTAELTSQSHLRSFTFQIRTCERLPYILVTNLGTGNVLVALKEHSQKVYLQAWFHAMLLVMAWDALRKGEVSEQNMLFSQTAARVEAAWEVVEQRLVEAGWNLEEIAILTVGRTMVRIQSDASRVKKEL